MTEELCTKKVNRGDSRWPRYFDCGRPVHQDGLCKMHFNAQQKREAKMRAEKERWGRSADAGAAADERVRQLASLGVEAKKFFDVRVMSGLGEYTGGVSLSPKATDLFIELLRNRP